MSPELEQLQALIGEQVVVDVAAPFVYLGTLKSLSLGLLVLTDADVHDLRDAEITREIYVLNSARDGIRRNRKEVSIRGDVVLSVSRVADVMDH
jgi:small nuclear ribonucleoprotein (snRNP)-like protein